MQNVILTGLPRSGTTLACLLLSQIDNFVALNEPMRTASYQSYTDALAGVPVYYQQTRDSILNRGVAVARAVNGKMTDNHFSVEKGIRKKLVNKEEIKIKKELTNDFRLGIKHNALFTILISDLMKTFPVYAFIRNPLSVLGSWNSLDLPVSKGRVRATRLLYPQLTQELDTMPDLYDRQLHILNWYFERYLMLPEENVIKYEDIIATDGAALKVIDPGAVSIQKTLSSKNKNKVYDQEVTQKLAGLLLDNPDHNCWKFYQPDQVEALL